MLQFVPEFTFHDHTQVVVILPVTVFPDASNEPVLLLDPVVTIHDHVLAGVQSVPDIIIVDSCDGSCHAVPSSGIRFPTKSFHELVVLSTIAGFIDHDFNITYDLPPATINVAAHCIVV